MKEYFIEIRVEDGELTEIMDRLRKAQEEIYQCYSALKSIGIVKIGKAPAENSEGEKEN